MIRLERPSAPTAFTENAERWQKQFDEARARNPRCAFLWYEIGGVTAREILMPVLREMTSEHCSYCDGYQSYELGETIDHFRPKSLFQQMAYSWPNLFLACSTCQKRRENFDDRLLKPDEPDYSFARYFDYDFASGRLRVAAGASAQEQDRALITIRLFDLNHPDRCKARKRAFERLKTSPADLERPCRFIERS